MQHALTGCLLACVQRMGCKGHEQEEERPHEAPRARQFYQERQGSSPAGPSAECQARTTQQWLAAKVLYLAALPRSIGRLAGLQMLRMRGCATLIALPEHRACSQRTLDMCTCSRLVSLPESLSCFVAKQMFRSASRPTRQRSHSASGRSQRCEGSTCRRGSALTALQDVSAS